MTCTLSALTPQSNPGREIAPFLRAQSTTWGTRRWSTGSTACGCTATFTAFRLRNTRRPITLKSRRPTRRCVNHEAESNRDGVAESQKAFTVTELLSKGIRLLVGVGVPWWVILGSPVAWAGPGGNIPGPGVCDYPGVGGSNFEAGATSYYCDFPVEENSTHWHCEYGGWNMGGPGGNAPIGGTFMGFGLTVPAGDFGGATGGCSWRWPDNTIGPAPNPPGAWKNYLVPKPPPPEHRAPPVPPAPPAEPESGPPPVVNPSGGDEPQSPAYTNPAFPNPGRTQNPPS